MKSKKLLLIFLILFTPSSIFAAEDVTGNDGTQTINGATGTNEDAIDITGNNNNITVTGTISASGSIDHGIDISGDNNTITIDANGSLTTNGSISRGVEDTGSGNTFINNGSINTRTGSISAGYYHSNLTSTTPFSVTNAGTITTGGSIARGIDITTSTASVTLTNSGTITTTGSQSTGINSSANFSTILNSGTISVSGAIADGISNYGNSVVITNTGSITTSGSLGTPIYSSGDNVIIKNSGTLTAASSTEVAIEMTGLNNILYLSPTSNITGTIKGANGSVSSVSNFGANSFNFGTELIGINRYSTTESGLPICYVDDISNPTCFSNNLTEFQPYSAMKSLSLISIQDFQKTTLTVAKNCFDTNGIRFSSDENLCLSSTGYNNILQIDPKDNFGGFDSDIFNASYSIQKRINLNNTIGFAYGNGNANLYNFSYDNQDANISQSSDNYAIFLLNKVNNFELKSIFSYSNFKNTSQRSTPFSTNANASYDLKGTSLQIIGSRPYSFEEGKTYITPNIGLTFTSIDQDSFNEIGSGGLVTMNSGTSDYSSLSFGTEIKGIVPLKNTKAFLIPKASFDFKKQSGYKNRYSGKFGTENVSSSERDFFNDTFSISVGSKLVINDQFELNLDIIHSSLTDAQSTLYGGGFRIKF